jgi:hypothetical protein
MAGVTIPGGSGLPPIVFTISGVSTTNQANAFAAAVQNAPVTTNLETTAESTIAGALNEIVSGAGGTATSFTLTTGGQYTVSDVGFLDTIVGSAAGDDNILGGGAITYMAMGDDNTVTFLDGSNTYSGGTSSGDVITGGSGFDVLDAGEGSNNTVFSGSGFDTIFLSDTGTGGDIAFLGDGQSTVVSTGLADTIAAEAPGNAIFVQGPATASDVINILPDAAGDLGNDTITLGAASVSVFDSVGGNSIFGGSGDLTFISAPGVSDTIVGGTGNIVMFTASGDSITLANDTTASTTSDIFVAGSGNETLDGSNALGGFTYFGDTTSADSASVATSVIGGAGTNYFSTGVGMETLDGGSGANVFNLNDGVGAAGDSITINDFSANDYVSFGSDSQSEITTILDNATVSNGNLTLTLSDNTTVTFTNVTSINTSHVI